ncbi:MAG: DUF503 domain-containing protein [Negativicutes bacterium]|jgi:uncharacterized protein YlxP (DUF503 family)
MYLAVVNIELVMPGNCTLSDKRNIVRSNIDKLKKLNLSVAEVGNQNLSRYAELAIACVGCEKASVERVIENVRSICDSCAADTATFDVEWL